MLNQSTDFCSYDGMMEVSCTSNADGEELVLMCQCGL